MMSSMAHEIASDAADIRIWVNLLFEGADAIRLANHRNKRHLKANTTFVRQLVMERLDQLDESSLAPTHQAEPISAL